MPRRRAAVWATAVTAVLVLLAGYFALQCDADQPVGHDPRDKANHHPKTE